MSQCFQFWRPEDMDTLFLSDQSAPLDPFPSWLLELAELSISVKWLSTFLSGSLYCQLLKEAVVTSFWGTKRVKYYFHRSTSFGSKELERDNTVHLCSILILLEKNHSYVEFQPGFRHNLKDELALDDLMDDLLWKRDDSVILLILQLFCTINHWYPSKSAPWDSFGDVPTCRDCIIKEHWMAVP